MTYVCILHGGDSRTKKFFLFYLETCPQVKLVTLKERLSVTSLYIPVNECVWVLMTEIKHQESTNVASQSY